MRKICLACVLLILLLSLSGCSAISTISDLLSPPALPKDLRNLQNVFEETYGEGVQYKTPVSGDYHSAFLLRDLDADGEDEALIFYLPDLLSTKVQLAAMDKIDGRWNCISSMDGDGTEVYSVDILDMDADGAMEVIVCWRSADSEWGTMTVYSSAVDSFALTRIFNTTYAQMLLSDLDGDDKTEIFFTAISPVTNGKLSVASVLSKDETGIVFLARQTLDSEVRSYGDVFVTPTDEGSILFMDGLKSGTQMITEVICWDADAQLLSAPLTDAETLLNTVSLRNEAIACRDITGDGIPEIPCQSVLENGEVWRSTTKLITPVYITTWCSYEDGVLVPVRETLMENDFGWMFTIPEVLKERFTISIDQDEHKWNFYETDRNTNEQEYLFSVIFTTESQWNSGTDGRNNSYTLLESSGKNQVYLRGLNEKGPLQIQNDSLKQAFEYCGG